MPELDRDRVLVRGSVGVWYLTRQQYLVLSAIEAAAGDPVPSSTIWEVLYGDDPDGWPENFDGRARVIMCRVRQSLRECGAGFQLERVGGGWCVVRDDLSLSAK
jgi:hypothetical protein